MIYCSGIKVFTGVYELGIVVIIRKRVARAAGNFCWGVVTVPILLQLVLYISRSYSQSLSGNES